MSRTELIRPRQAIAHTPRDEFERKQWLGSERWEEWLSETSREHCINAMWWFCGALDWGRQGELANAMHNIQRGQQQANEAERWAGRQHLIIWC